MKVLFDTDIGSDIDDAVCLAYLLANPECELVGVTTVSGQPAERAKLASVLCKAANQPGVPVVPGAEAPFSGRQRQPLAKQASVLPRWPHESRFPRLDAVDFMAETIHSHERQVTLLAVGPMTNVAALFKKHPGVAGSLNGLMLMSGRFGPKPPSARADHEWNVYCDPVAADIVYRTRVPVHRSVGLDVTLQVQMEEQAVRAKFSAHPGLLPVLDMATVWYQDAELMTFHDPLAAASLFDGRVCGFQRGRVEVDTGSGVTSWTRSEGGAHEVALTVDPKRFFESYFGVFER